MDLINRFFLIHYLQIYLLKIQSHFFVKLSKADCNETINFFEVKLARARNAAEKKIQ